MSVETLVEDIVVVDIVVVDMRYGLVDKIAYTYYFPSGCGSSSGRPLCKHASQSRGTY